MAIIGTGQVTLSDLNDAIMSGTPPANPTNGTLWIDESASPKLLKKWDGVGWVVIGEVLDEGTGRVIEDIEVTLGNMANDSLLDFSERQIIKDRLTDIVGYVIADTATTLPTTATNDAGTSGKGSFYYVRKDATMAGLTTSHTAYIAVATEYTNLKTYLEGLTPIDAWDLSDANKGETISVVKSDFRDKWLKYYNAEKALANATADQLKKNVDNVAVGGTNYASNGSFTRLLTDANWKNYYNGQINEIVDISTETPPFQFAYHVKNTSNALGGIEVAPLWSGASAEALVNKEVTVQFWLKYSGIVQGASAVNNGRFGEIVLEGENATGTKYYRYLRASSTSTSTESTYISGTNTTWVKYTVTHKLTLPTSATKLVKISLRHGLYSCVGEFWTTGVKVEIGNKVTDWSENPSDLDGRINFVEQKVTPDSIVTTIRSSQTYKDDLKAIEDKVAKILTLNATSNIMFFDENDNPKPSNQIITFTANAQNIIGTPTFTATPYNSSGTALTAITLSGTGSSRNLDSTQWLTTYSRIVVEASLEGYSDSITIVKIKDGAKGSTGSTGQSAIVGLLTNESITLSADSSGTVTSFTSATGTFEVYEGTVKKTGTAVTYAMGTQTGCTVSINTSGVYTVSAMSADTATAIMTATYGGVTISKTLSLSKSKQGVQGQKGDTGVGVSSITEYYLASASASGVTTSTTGWTTAIQTITSTNKYLWNYEKTTYTNGTTANTTPVIIGTYGEKGDEGNAGKGISAITEYYLATSASSGVTTATAGWTTTMQTTTPTNKYLWNYEKITYTDASTTTINPIIIGVHGDKGDTGSAGVSVSSIVEEYYHSTSATSQTGGSWTTTVPTWADGKYVWTRAKTTFSNGTTSYTSPVNVTGSKGTNGVTYYTWVRYADDASGNGMSDSPSGKRYMGIATNKTTSTESGTATDYTWSPLYDNVNVGGRNLIKDSNFFVQATETSYAQILPVNLIDGLDLDRMFIGKKLAFSYYVHSLGAKQNSDTQTGSMASRFGIHGSIVWKNSSTGATSNEYPFASYLDQSVNNERVVMYHTVNPPSGYDTIQSFSFSFQPYARPAVGNTEVWQLGQPKLEIGNIATDWTLAPEEVVTGSELENTTTSLKTELQTYTDQQAGSVQTTLTELITDTESNITKAYQLEISETTKNFNLEFSEMSGRIDGNEAGLAQVNTYFDFSSAGLLIGKSDSPLQINLTNSQMDFIDNGVTVAYINGQKMYIDALDVITSLEVGNHKIEKYNGEITFVKYIG